MKRFWRNNSLSIVMFSLFLLFLIGHSVTGWHEYNEEQQEHQQSTVAYRQYLTTGHFIETVFENWESEFLQMGAYVILTVMLFQQGSAESKKLIGNEAVDAKPKHSKSKDAPWAVRKGGLVLE